MIRGARPDESPVFFLPRDSLVENVGAFVKVGP